MLGLRIRTTVALLMTAQLGIAQALTPEEILEHANCVFFGPRHDAIASVGVVGRGGRPQRSPVDSFTSEVVARLTAVSLSIPGGSRTNTKLQLDQLGLIDRHTFQAMNDAGVSPADVSSDAEFCRRVTLDLTGRIPTSDRLLQFLADPASDKRSKYVGKGGDPAISPESYKLSGHRTSSYILRNREPNLTAKALVEKGPKDEVLREVGGGSHQSR